MRVLTAVTRLVVRLAVAVLVTAAVGLGVPSAAQAATCSTAQGVSVVVDFHQLGGGVQTHCDRGGAGRTAWDQLRDVGYELAGVKQQPGFVCRIDGKPSQAQDACFNTPPADAYWSLWWSDGKSGKWAFSSMGAGSLKVPEGGYVAMSWQGQQGQAEPGVAPKAHPTSSPSASPTGPAPSHHPSNQPSNQPSSMPASSAPVAPSTGPTTGPTGKPSAHPSKQAVKPAKHHRASGASAQTQEAGPVGKLIAADAGDSAGSGGLPGWVAPIAIVVLFAGASAFVVARRKSSGGPG